MDAVENGVMPSGYLRDIVERVTPSVLTAHRAGLTSADEIETEHVRSTIRLLTERSSLIAERIRDGRLAIVGAAYELHEGRARVVDAVGDLGDLGPLDGGEDAGGAAHSAARPAACRRTAGRGPREREGAHDQVVGPDVRASGHACGGDDVAAGGLV